MAKFHGWAVLPKEKSLKAFYSLLLNEGLTKK